MNKNNINVAKKTLKFLEKNSWKEITISKVISKKEKISINNKKELLININRYFDYLLKQNASTIENSSSKDMLFEVLMARFDILNIYRLSIQNLFNYIKVNPHEFISLLPSFIDSMILISTLANLDVNGIKGIPKIKALFLIYIITSFTWNDDSSKSLEKTMTALDKYLSQIDKFYKIA